MRAFAFLGVSIHYIAYLDEFGHIGPFVSRQHPQHNTSPVFGLGGFVLPSSKVRAFATWFYQLKCNLLQFEIDRDGIPGLCNLFSVNFRGVGHDAGVTG